MEKLEIAACPSHFDDRKSLEPEALKVSPDGRNDKNKLWKQLNQ